MKRLLSAVLAAAMMLCAMPTAFAASDIDGHWARSYILALDELDIYNPSATEGTYLPEQAVTRAEFMRYLNRAFGFTEKAAISYSDVSASDWYYDTVQTAVYYGYINGVGNGRMSPNGLLTREQAATILGRLHKIVPDADGASLTFADKSAIQSFSLPYIADAVNKGYLNGYTDGTFKPQNNLKRGEAAKIIYYFMGSSLGSENGVYTAANLNAATENVSLSKAGTLSDVTVKGNLYITEGVGTGAVTLRNVTIEGDLIVSGGTITLDGVGAKRMVVSNPTGVQPQVTGTGNTNIGETIVQTSATLREQDLAATAGGLSDLTLAGDGLTLTLDAHVWNVNVTAPATISTTGSADINRLTADARTTVAGGGTVQRAVINVNGCELTMNPSTYELAGGVTATFDGETVSSSSSVSVSPAALTIDASNINALAHSYDFTFSMDQNELARIVCNGKTLTVGSDYNLLSGQNGIRLYRTYLTTLSAGSYTLDLYFDSGDHAVIGLVVTTSASGAITPSAITFDKYEESVGYADQTVTVTLPTGTTLSTIRLAGVALERGTDYTYNQTSGVVVLRRDTLAKKGTGSYTISFVPSQGSTLSCALTVTDTSPVNAVIPESIDFDANVNSGGYADISVTLSPAKDETLRSIRCNGKTLEEDWQYRVSGSTITISKSAIASFSGSGANFADFTFLMSSGKNPVLRVNYVTTIALTALVVDDLGAPIAGASVTFTPSDAETGTPTQTVATGANGTATVYVKRGSYKIEATDARFTGAISDTVSVTVPKTVTLTGEILESVSVTVTNSYGAPLSGAYVTIGGKSVTTGADGTAVFSLKRGSYVVQASCNGYRASSTTITVNGTVRERVMLS